MVFILWLLSFRYKPVDLKIVITPFREDFEILFCETFSRKQNVKFLSHIQECFSRRKWSDLFKLVSHTHKAALQKCASGWVFFIVWLLFFFSKHILFTVQIYYKKEQHLLNINYLLPTNLHHSVHASFCLTVTTYYINYFSNLIKNGWLIGPFVILRHV